MTSLFERLPENLFGPLAAPSKAFYWDLLLRLYDHYFGPESSPPDGYGYLQRTITSEIERFRMFARAGLTEVALRLHDDPMDALQIIGFGRYAAPLSTLELAGIEPDYVQGTNLHHALHLAGRHLRRHPDGESVVLVVTDGEPTAHLEPDGSPHFSYPPDPETVHDCPRIHTKNPVNINTCAIRETAEAKVVGRHGVMLAI